MKNLKKAFTLIELLIVIGILAILIVAVISFLNPAESQRKARDLQRQNNAQQLSAIVSQIIQGNKQNCSSYPCVKTIYGTATTASLSCTGTGNVFASDISSYCSKLPKDPDTARNYVIEIDPAGTYKITVDLESADNATLESGDGGDDTAKYEVGTNLAL